jgi:hypothetical protein
VGLLELKNDQRFERGRGRCSGACGLWLIIDLVAQIVLTTEPDVGVMGET